MTFTNQLGEMLGPVLLWLRNLGFFEWYVFMPLMTAISVYLFWILVWKLNVNGTFDGHRATLRRLWHAAYFGLCFLATNAMAVGLKTLIVEELDYPTRVWFEAYVGPIHFYIVAVTLAYLTLIVRNMRSKFDQALGLFVQVGLVAGYAVGIFRVFNEPISFADPTTGLSGFVLCAYFALYNYDLYQRFLGIERNFGV